MYRIATWNLDRPIKNRIRLREARVAEIVRQSADLWILTETDRNLVIDGFKSLATKRPEDPSYGDEEAYAVIQFKSNLQAIKLPTFDERFAVCARFPASPLGPLIVYASIITYHMDGVREGKATWAMHQESAQQHGKDWVGLCERFPDHTLVVAGDYNQALDGIGRYRNDDSTALINAAFSAAGLECLTREDFVANKKLVSRHSVDHIAISERALARWASEITAWEGGIPPNPKLSDHNGVAVTLRARTPERPDHE
jgi:endonuclease/exonuclease/phosphatase family metal-dependent hydrolase